MLQQESAQQENKTKVQKPATERQKEDKIEFYQPAYINNVKVEKIQIIFNPKIYDDPTSSKERFSYNLWTDKEIKSIRQMKRYVQISVSQKRTVFKQRRNNNKLPQQNEQSTVNHVFKNQCRKKELTEYQLFFRENLPLLNKKREQKQSQDEEEKLNQFINNIKISNFVIWFMPLRDEGPKLRKMIISNETLKALGYEPEEFSFEIERYTEIVTDFWSADAYKTVLSSFLSAFKNFAVSEINGSITHQQCVEKSIIQMQTDMQGKNGISYKIKMTWFMPEISIICYDIDRIVEVNFQRAEEVAEVRENKNKQINNTTFNSLSKVTKLPKQIDPTNTHRRCEYIEIPNAGLLGQKNIEQSPINQMSHESSDSDEFSPYKK